MNIAVVKLLSRPGPRSLRLAAQNVIRMKSTEEPSSPSEKPSKEEPCPKPSKEEPPCPKPAKEEPPCPKPGESTPKPNDPPPAKPEEKEPCPPPAKAKNPCPTPVSAKAKEPCPPKKQEPCPPPVSPKFTCPEPPPCPPIPTGAPVICPKVVDNSNPCNYVPPECPDPNTPNLTKLKKLQCLFQEENGIPLYLKRGNMDALLYQSSIVLVFISLAMATYSTIMMK